MKKHFFLLFVVFSFFSCSEENNKGKDSFVISGEAQGTTFTIKYYNKQQIKELANQVNLVLQEIDNSLSTYKKDSYISKWNRNEELKTTDVHFFKMFLLSKKVYLESNHYFDPTIQPLSQFYGFEKGENLNSLDSILEFVGFNLLSDSNNFILKKDKRIQLNYNAIAQGYTVDLLKELLEKNNLHNFIIELGGEIYCSGTKPENKKWKVAVDKAEKNRDGKYHKILEVSDKAIATSGNYRKWIKNPESNEKFVHTINPITGESKATDIMSVTVYHKNCGLADAYATAILSMGKEKSKHFLSKTNLKTDIIY